MKPYKIFLLFFSIMVLLIGFAFLFPEKGIEIMPGIKLKFFTDEQLFSKNKITYKDISEILAEKDTYNVTYKPDTLINPVKEQTTDTIIQYNQDNQPKINKNSSGPKQESLPQKTKKELKEDSLKTIIHHLEYPGKNKAVLYPFFESLLSLEQNNKLIRILHYGDSQIEGDRITSYIREQFQKRFGGSGIGLFPAVLRRKHNVSVRITTSSSWETYSIRDRKKVPNDHQRYGILLSFSRFTSFSAHNQQDAVYDGWIKIKKTNYAYPLTRKFKSFKIFYGYNKKPLITQKIYHDTTFDAEILPPTDQLELLEWSFLKTPDEFTLSFKGEDSPNVYAFALDDNKGVAVDNISLRGSSGLEFKYTDSQFFRDMYKKLNVRLILLQFGVNVVPHVVDDYTYYENKFYQQLKYIREMNPGIPVIVLGLSDMSKKKNDYYVSYPNIEKIRNAQKKAAFKAGCVFWDTYEAMGGHNSMPSWVFSNPPLAHKDFTHFTYRGSKIIARMFYNSLLNDYNNFLNQSVTNIE